MSGRAGVSEIDRTRVRVAQCPCSRSSQKGCSPRDMHPSGSSRRVETKVQARVLGQLESRLTRAGAGARLVLTSVPKRCTMSLDASRNDASRDIVARWRSVVGGEDVPGKRSSDPRDLLPLTPVALNVLLALADGERHGYGIMLEVRERTGGRVRLGPGTLYGAIKRLKEGGLIVESGERPDPEGDDERRCYYRLTRFGGEVLAAEVQRLDGLVRAARCKGAFPAPKPSPEGA